MITLPIELVQKIFMYVKSDVADLLKEQIESYNKYTETMLIYKPLFSYYCLKSFGLFRTGNVYCDRCHTKQKDMFVDFCDNCNLCFDCCYYLH